MRDLPAGHSLTEMTSKSAIPLQKGQIPCRNYAAGEVLLACNSERRPLMIESIDRPLCPDPSLTALISVVDCEEALALNGILKTQP